MKILILVAALFVIGYALFPKLYVPVMGMAVRKQCVGFVYQSSCNHIGCPSYCVGVIR